MTHAFVRSKGMRWFHQRRYRDTIGKRTPLLNNTPRAFCALSLSHATWRRCRIGCVAIVLKCGDTVLPEVVVARRLKIFLEDDLDRLFPRDRWVRALAHPTRLPARVAPYAGEGEATAAAAAGVEAIEGGKGEAGSEAPPVPGLRFSELEPPRGETNLRFPLAEAFVVVLGQPFEEQVDRPPSVWRRQDLFAPSRAAIEFVGSKRPSPSLT